MNKLISYEDLQKLCIERGDALIDANNKLLDTMREVERLRAHIDKQNHITDHRAANGVTHRRKAIPQ